MTKQTLEARLHQGNIRTRDIGTMTIQNENEVLVTTKFHPPKTLVLDFGTAAQAQAGLTTLKDLTSGDANLGVKPKTLAGGPALTPTNAWC